MYLSTRPLILAAIMAGAQCVMANVAFSQAAQPASPAAQATPDGLSAREIFYLADEVAPPAKAKPAAPATPHKTTHARATPPPTQTAQATEPRGNAGYSETAQSGGHFQNITDRKYPALGMRYAVYRVAGGSKEPVDADSVFHSNDHVQLTVDVNAPAYLYVISRGSSGKWTTLFPAADAAQNANLIQPRAGYTFPSPGELITFTDPAGKEELFLFLSRQPVNSTEDLMLQIASKSKSVPAEKHDEQLPHSNVVEAFNRMDDSQVNLLRDAYSRDLIVEKVNTDSNAASTPPVAQAPPKDNSVYVVNPSAGADAHVVADVTFRHE